MIIKKRIISAVIDVLKSNSEVVQYFKSFNPEIAPEGTSIPHVVYSIVVSSPNISMDRGYYEDVIIQVDSYSFNYDELNEISSLIKESFENSRWIPIDDGFISCFIRISDWIKEDPDSRSESGDVVFRHTLNLSATVSKQRK